MRSALVKLLVGGLLAVLLVVATTGASGEHPPENVREVLAGQRARLALPPTNEPKGVAVYFHGQGGNVNDRIDGPWLDALRRDGWVIATSSFHDESWGNPASTADAKRVAAWASEQGGAPVKLFIGGSMGATVSLNAIIHGAAKPKCWYGMKAAVDPTNVDTIPGARRFIAKAYGGPVPADRVPVQNVDKLPDGIRYRFVASPIDPLVPFDENTGRMVQLLQFRGADVSLRTVDGGHEDPSHLNAFDLVDFARGCV